MHYVSTVAVTALGGHLFLATLPYLVLLLMQSMLSMQMTKLQ